MAEVVVYELECKVYLLKNIEYKYVQSDITAFIDCALCADEEMKKFHEDKKSFKNYTYSCFNEIEADRMYKMGNVYSFKLRTTDEKTANYLKTQLPLQYNDKIKGIVCTSRIIPRRFITKLYSVTPALIASDKGYWKNVMNISEYERLLFENAVKKYNSIAETKIDENFKIYDVLSFTNRVPISTYYKGKKMLCDKLELMIGDDPRSQDIAYMLLGTGICNRNSRGYGYVNYKYN
jgi:CRISPR-associated endoribonuclease Cas6